MPIPFDWEQLGSLPGDAEPTTILNAARADLNHAATDLVEHFDVALPFRVEETEFDQPGEPRLVITIHQARVEITTSALLSARKKGVGPVDTVASAVARPRTGTSPEQAAMILERDWRAKRVGSRTTSIRYAGRVPK